MKQNRLTFSTLFFLLMLPFNLWAAAPPTNAYPTTFNDTGTIDRVDAEKGEIVIDDSLMLLPATTTVHRPSSRFSSNRDLRKGMKIGFSQDKVNGKKSITEIWVLPN